MYAFTHKKEKTMSPQKKNLKWLIAHKPEHLFIRTAKAFAEILEEIAPQFQIEILTTDRYKEMYDKDFSEKKILGLLKNNVIQMSQTEVWEVGEMSGDKNFYVFDVPFLFKNHEHARKVLEGPIGQQINQRLGAKTGIRGLAYTYSGGYRTIGSDVSIANLSELANKKIRISGNPVTQQFFKKLGVDIYRGSLGTWADPSDPSSDLTLPEGVHGKDTTYIRYTNAKNFLKSEHSLFLTDILVNETFFQTLSNKEQELFMEAAKRAARLERQWSQEDAEKFETTAKERGCDIVSLTSEDRAKMEQAGEEVKQDWKEKFLPGLIDQISNTH